MCALTLLTKQQPFSIYILLSKLKFDGRDIVIGASIVFEVKVIGQPGKCDQAVNVTLN